MFRHSLDSGEAHNLIIGVHDGGDSFHHRDNPLGVGHGIKHVIAVDGRGGYAVFCLCEGYTHEIVPAKHVWSHTATQHDLQWLKVQASGLTVLDA